MAEIVARGAAVTGPEPGARGAGQKSRPWAWSELAHRAGRAQALGGVAGQTVLIHAAAGGTGQAAVKMAKHETMRALGADHVLDSRSADLAAEVLRRGLNVGVLAQAAPQIFGGVMGELLALIAAGVLKPCSPDRTPVITSSCTRSHRK